MSKRSLLAVASCVVVIAGAGSSAAFAGEVKGPPGDGTTQPGGNPNSTGAPANSNSNCSYSGLNDFDSLEGQNERITQTPHDVPVPGIAGHGNCAGGTNESRAK